MKLPEHIEEYLVGLTINSQDTTSIWLFGSQVNGGARADSDWDILIFGNDRFLNHLKQHGPQPPSDVSIMIVYNGNNFKSPWPRKKDGVYERGSLSEWKWSYQSEGEAKYEGCKELPNGRLRTRWEKAIRVSLRL